MTRSLLVLVFAAALLSREGCSASAPPTEVAESLSSGVRFASPLQTFTVWDREVDQSPRSQFLTKYRAGLMAEAEKRKELASKRKEYFGASDANWATKAARNERLRRKQEDELLEEAFDQAAASVDTSIPDSPKKRDGNGYQFVGVVNKASADKPITWYARKKPADAEWSMKLVHVNRDAIIKDLFNRGKVDVFAKYHNTGQVDEQTGKPVVKANYEIRERSWRNLWNFSPKHFFTDSSGMYWRERRLRPGLYTDGSVVYESSYRYGDGRNGMRQLTRFDEFMRSKAVDQSTKENILKRLQKDAPDIVLEE